LIYRYLYGERCRYDGKVFENYKVKKIVEEGKAILVCPEVLGGMSVPRLPCPLVCLPLSASKLKCQVFIAEE